MAEIPDSRKYENPGHRPPNASANFRDRPSATPTARPETNPSTPKRGGYVMWIVAAIAIAVIVLAVS